MNSKLEHKAAPEDEPTGTCRMHMGGARIRNAANILTLSRIGFAVAVTFTTPFSAVFWTCYLLGGISDLLDGPVARKLRQQSMLGARLDSIADLAFAAALISVAVRTVRFPTWLWIGIGMIALIRIVCYSIGFCKYRTFCGLHTRLNKAAGAAAFAFPLLYALLGVGAAGAIVCLPALGASIEELLITIRSDKLMRDRKSIFTH